MAGTETTQNEAGGFTRIGAGPRYKMIEVQVDSRALNALREAVHNAHRSIDQYVPSAMNKAASEMRTWLQKQFGSRMNIGRKASIRDRLTLWPKASRDNWSAGVRIALTRFTVTSFKGTRQTKEGVQWQPQSGRTQLIPRAFIQQGFTHAESGKYIELRQAWRRAGPMGRGAKLVPRHPLFVMRGPSLARVFTDDPEFQSQAETVASQILTKKIGQQVDRIVGTL